MEQRARNDEPNANDQPSNIQESSNRNGEHKSAGHQGGSPPPPGTSDRYVIAAPGLYGFQGPPACVRERGWWSCLDLFRSALTSVDAVISLLVVR